MIIDITTCSQIEIQNLITQSDNEERTGHMLSIELEEFTNWAKGALPEKNKIYIMKMVGTKLWVSPDDPSDLLHIQLKWVN